MALLSRDITFLNNQRHNFLEQLYTLNGQTYHHLHIFSVKCIIYKKINSTTTDLPLMNFLFKLMNSCLFGFLSSSEVYIYFKYLFYILLHWCKASYSNLYFSLSNLTTCIFISMTYTYHTTKWQGRYIPDHFQFSFISLLSFQIHFFGKPMMPWQILVMAPKFVTTWC